MSIILLIAGILFFMGIIATMSMGLMFIAFFAMIYFFSQGDAVHGIISLGLMFFFMAISPSTYTIQRW
jgi:hypothetical protein